MELKNYRVVCRKNMGNGNRVRIVIEAEDFNSMVEQLDEKIKDERLRPMRIYEMQGEKQVNKYRVSTNRYNDIEEVIDCSTNEKKKLQEEPSKKEYDTIEFEV